MNTHPLTNNKYFPVLDHGFVALIDFMGDDDAIVQAARSSYGPGTKSRSDSRALIRYLRRHRHTTPFEMGELKFHVRLPIFVARQLVRHRTATLNEQSLRYSLAPLQFYMPEYEAVRKQSPMNKQGRDAAVLEDIYQKVRARWERVRATSSEAYVAALEDDIARELARIDLPLSLYTEWYWKINLHNLFHFLGLRADSHAQWEIQEYARVKGGIVKELFPIAFEAWIDYNFCARTLSRMELRALRRLAMAGAIDDGLTEAVLMDEFEMTQREAKEFRYLLENDPVVPSFDLDMASAKTAEHYYVQALGAVPAIDVKA